MKGIDISNLQGTVDISKVKVDGYGFVISKATEGSTFVDTYCPSNVANTIVNGLIAGAYHFARFKDKAGALNEANFFKSHCPSGVKFVVLDFEQQCSGNMTDACLAFLDSVASIAQPVIYCNPNYIKLYLDSRIIKYPLWIAQYKVSAPSFKLWSKYAIWQYTEKGSVPGIGGYSDVNISGPDFDKLITGSSSTKINKFCKNRTTPILNNFITTGHAEFKPYPDINATTNGIRESGFTVNIYGKNGAFYSVLPNGKQFLPISTLKAGNPLSIQKIIKVIDWNGVKCYENPDDSDPSISNGTIPYKTYLPVYIDVDGYYLVNGANANLQWINNNNQVTDVYPNKFSTTLTQDSKPILENFAAIEDNVSILEMPYSSAKSNGSLKKGEIIQVYGKFGDYYLISNIEKKFVYIPKLINTKPLSIIKTVKVINAEGAYCRENTDNQDKNNGLVSVGTELKVYLEFDGYYLVNGSNINLQWVSKEDVK